MKDPARGELVKFVDRSKELGAYDAKIVKASTIKTAVWTRLRCQYGCRSYGSYLCCPPYSPKPNETQEAINDYKYALMMHSKSEEVTKKIVPTLEREIFLDGYYKAFGFVAGRCHLCEKCNLKSCVHPREARLSMEAAGIDVYETARVNGFPIKVVKDKTCEGNYYSLILIE